MLMLVYRCSHSYILLGPPWSLVSYAKTHPHVVRTAVDANSCAITRQAHF